MQGEAGGLQGAPVTLDSPPATRAAAATAAAARAPSLLPPASWGPSCRTWGDPTGCWGGGGPAAAGGVLEGPAGLRSAPEELLRARLPGLRSSRSWLPLASLGGLEDICVLARSLIPGLCSL